MKKLFIHMLAIAAIASPSFASANDNLAIYLPESAKRTLGREFNYIQIKTERNAVTAGDLTDRLVTFEECRGSLSINSDANSFVLLRNESAPCRQLALSTASAVDMHRRNLQRIIHTIGAAAFSVTYSASQAVGAGLLMTGSELGYIASMPIQISLSGALSTAGVFMYLGSIPIAAAVTTTAALNQSIPSGVRKRLAQFDIMEAIVANQPLQVGYVDNYSLLKEQVGAIISHTSER